MRSTLIAVVLLTVATVAWSQQGLRPQVEALKQQGRYDEALAMLDRHGVSELPPDLAWVRAQLLTEPAAFDKAVGDLLARPALPDGMHGELLLARARERFARGQYLSCLQDLQRIDVTTDPVGDEVLLYQAMASGAVGEVRQSRRSLEQIPADSDHHAMAAVLLTDALLRAGQLEEAYDLAEPLAQRGSPVAAQGLYAQIVALRRLGRSDEAQSLTSILLREHHSSAEADWVRQGSSTAPAPETGTPASGIAEVDAPTRRVDFSLQFGAFHDRAMALRMASALEGSVQQLRIERDTTTSPPWYRVVGGRFPTRAQAMSALSDLGDRVERGIILAPGDRP